MYTITSGWSIVYLEESNATLKTVFLSLKIFIVSANSADPVEMLYYAAFHLGLHCLPKHPF